MKNKNILLYLLISTSVITACSSEDDLIQERLADNPVITDPPLTGEEGSADLSNYVAIGNSITAGFMDAALYTDGQMNSYPNILANHFVELKFMNTGEFQQPDINSLLGFNTAITNPGPNNTIFGRFELNINPAVAPIGPLPTTGGDPIGPYSGAANELNNFGVPNIKIGQLLTPYTGGPAGNPAYNPFYARFASNAGSSTILGDVISAAPTFYTLWIGNVDVLGYAVTGGDGSVSITSTSDFQNYYQTVLTQLLQAGAKGVAINLPPVLTLPYFRAVPYNPLPLTQAQADQLNQGYAQYNGGLAQAQGAGLITAEEKERRTISFTAGQNAFVMEDESLTNLSGLGLPNYRQTEPTDLIPLSTASALATGVGTSSAAKDKHVLIPQEQVEIVTARATFNAIIAGVVAGINSQVGATVVGHLDVGPLIADLVGLTPTQAAQLALSQAAQTAADGDKGLVFQGLEYQPDFSPNGLYSTDGIHFNPKGHAIIANAIVDAINASFGATIPDIDITPFRTVITY